MDKVRVQRANVILQISPQQVDYYMNQGYNVIDADGNVVKASVPRDLGTLQKAYVDNQAEIQKLHEEIDKLTEELAKQKQQKSTRNKKAVE